MNFRQRALQAGLGLLLVLAPALALSVLPPPAAAATDAPDGARLFGAWRPALFTVQVLGREGGRPSAQGSAFAVTPDGRLATCYHVVALQLSAPQRHALAVVDADGRSWPARVLAFDIADDTALLAIDRPTPVHLDLAARPAPVVGTPLYSLGNPRDLGLTLMVGHYSGRVRSLGVERIHFSGSLNPGMSGGPVVDARGRLVGVNAARQAMDEQIGLLAPADAVQRLLARAPVRAEPLTPAQVHAAVTAQVRQWQDQLPQRLQGARWSTTALGPYRLPDVLPNDLRCRSGTNEVDELGREIRLQRLRCDTGQRMGVDDDTGTGHVQYERTHLQADRLGAVRFARLLQRVAAPDLTRGPTRTMALQRCVDRTTLAGPQATLPVRVMWCADAYRDLPGLYDIDIAIVTQDRPQEAAVARLVLEGVRWDTGTAYLRYLLENLQ